MLGATLWDSCSVPDTVVSDLDPSFLKAAFPFISTVQTPHAFLHNVYPSAPHVLLLVTDAKDAAHCLRHLVVLRLTKPELAATVVVPRTRGHWRRHLARFELVQELKKDSPAWQWSNCSLDEVTTSKPLQVFYAAPKLKRDHTLATLGEGRLKMTYDGTLGHIPCTFMLDTQASDCFVSKSFLERNNMNFEKINGEVQLGDGTHVAIHGRVSLHVALQQYKAKVSLLVVNLGPGFEVVLGDSWLTKTKAILRYWDGTCVLRKGQRQFTMTSRPALKPKGSKKAKVKMSQSGSRKKGVPGLSQLLLTAMQFKRFVRKGGSRCFLVILQNTDDKINDSGQPEALKALLDEYRDVFADPPKGLPPDRGEIRVIPLEPGAKPSCIVYLRWNMPR
jgi:hypothetical protein